MSARSFQVVACLCVGVTLQTAFVGTAQAAQAGCDFSHIESRQLISDTVQINGAQLNIILHQKWNFEPQPDGMVRITEIGDAELSNFTAIIASAISSQAQIPRNDCDVYASIDGSSVSVNQPMVTVHFDMSATKWACPGLDVPCPTFAKPFRTCYKRLAKTIIGSGSGWYEAYLTPSFAGNDIVINTSQNSGFKLSQGTLAALGVIFGPIGPIAANVAVASKKLDFAYPSITLPASELEPGDVDNSIQLNWTNNRVYFAVMDHINGGGSAIKTIDLVRERYINQRPNTACFIHKTLSGL